MLPYEALFAEDMRKDPRFHWRDYDTPRKV